MIDHQDAAGFQAVPAVAVSLAFRPDIDGLKIAGSADDFREPHAEFFLDARIEAPAIAIRGVLRVVVAPGDRPVVAIDGGALHLRRERHSADYGTGRVRTAFDDGRH